MANITSGSVGSWTYLTKLFQLQIYLGLTGKEDCERGTEDKFERRTVPCCGVEILAF